MLVMYCHKVHLCLLLHIVAPNLFLALRWIIWTYCTPFNPCLVLIHFVWTIDSFQLIFIVLLPIQSTRPSCSPSLAIINHIDHPYSALEVNLGSLKLTFFALVLQYTGTGREDTNLNLISLDSTFPLDSSFPLDHSFLWYLFFYFIIHAWFLFYFIGVKLYTEHFHLTGLHRSTGLYHFLVSNLQYPFHWTLPFNSTRRFVL